MFRDLAAELALAVSCWHTSHCLSLGPFPPCIPNFLSHGLRSGRVQKCPAGMLLISGLEHGTEEPSEGEAGEYPEMTLFSEAAGSWGAEASASLLGILTECPTAPCSTDLYRGEGLHLH